LETGKLILDHPLSSEDALRNLYDLILNQLTLEQLFADKRNTNVDIKLVGLLSHHRFNPHRHQSENVFRLAELKSLEDVSRETALFSKLMLDAQTL
jgi:hypothetical protein